jgi:hypothetical protein
MDLLVVNLSRALIVFLNTRRILEDEVASNVAIQSRHRCPNPSACNISKRKTQLTESKALEMSNLMKNDGCLALCKALITLRT